MSSVAIILCVLGGAVVLAIGTMVALARWLTRTIMDDWEPKARHRRSWL